MKKKNLIFIGPMNLGNIPETGDTMKNQLFLDRFVQVFDKVITIDTMNWKTRPWVMVRLVRVLLMHPKTKVVISANPGSADTLIRFIKKMHLKNECFYWVVGGTLHNNVKTGKVLASTYE